MQPCAMHQPSHALAACPVPRRTLTFTWVAILIGLLYYGMPDDGTSLRARLNLCYVGLSFVVLMPYISMGLYTSDKKFYLADASAKLYRPVAYYLAKVGEPPPLTRKGPTQRSMGVEALHPQRSTAAWHDSCATHPGTAVCVAKAYCSPLCLSSWGC